MFSSILAKFGTSFFDLKMSLKHKRLPHTIKGIIVFCCTCAWHSLDSGDLDHPAHVWRVHFVVNEPLGETVPLFWTGTVDGKPWLCMLVLTLLQIVGHFLLKGQSQSALIRLSITVCHTLMRRAK